KKRVGDISETHNREKEKNQSEIKNTVKEIKNALDRINRLDKEKQQINCPEDRVMESNQVEQRRGEKVRKLRSLRELSDSIKYSNICITGISEEERDKGADNLLEEIAENFPNLGKETDIQIQEAQRFPPKMQP
ncbi:LORF1 protein, partial [Crocuta crocuta]